MYRLPNRFEPIVKPDSTRPGVMIELDGVKYSVSKAEAYALTRKIQRATALSDGKE